MSKVQRGVCSYCEKPVVAGSNAGEQALEHPVLGRRWRQVWLCTCCAQVVHDLRQSRQGTQISAVSDRGQVAEDPEPSCSLCADASSRLLQCQRCEVTFCGRCFGNTLGERQAPPGVLGVAGHQALKRLNEVLSRSGRPSHEERVWALPSRLWVCPLCRREYRMQRAFRHWFAEQKQATDEERLLAWVAFRERYERGDTDSWWRRCRWYQVPSAAACCSGDQVRRMLEAASVGDWHVVQSIHEPYANVLAYLGKSRAHASLLLASQLDPAPSRETWVVEPLQLSERAQALLEQYPLGPRATRTALSTTTGAAITHVDADWHRVYAILQMALREALVALAWSQLKQVDTSRFRMLPAQADVFDTLLFDWNDLWQRYGAICFRCGRRGEPAERLQVCDVRGCGRVYHASCVSCLSREPLLGNGLDERVWYCPRHFDRVTGRYLPSEPLPVCLASWLQSCSLKLPDGMMESIPLLGVAPRAIHTNVFASTDEVNERDCTAPPVSLCGETVSSKEAKAPFRAVQCRTCPFSCLISKAADSLETSSDWYRWSERLISCARCREWLEPPLHPWIGSKIQPIEHLRIPNPVRMARSLRKQREQKRLKPATSHAMRRKAPNGEVSSASFEKALRQAICEGAERIQEAKARGDSSLIQGRSGEYIDALEQVREEYEKYEKGNTGAVVALMAALKSAGGRPMSIAELTLEVFRRGWYVTRGKTPQMTFAAFFSTKRQRLLEQGQTSTWFAWLDHGLVRWAPH
jgi:hypothetical protein